MLTTVHDPAPGEKAADPALDRADQIVHLFVGRREGWMKLQTTRVFGIHAIQHECVDVDVQIERRPRLHAPSVDLTGLERDLAKRVEDWRGLLIRHVPQARQILKSRR